MSEDADTTEAGASGCQVSWPWYVRWLAVGYVLSLVAGPVGFFVLASVGGFLILREGPAWDGNASIAFVMALACPLGCAVYRQWFRSWGRRRWPQSEPENAR